MDEIKFNKEKLSKTLKITRILFKYFQKDHFSIYEALKILNTDKLPAKIPIKNNKIFIKDISEYIFNNNIPIDENRIKNLIKKEI